MKDVLINKIATFRRCLTRIKVSMVVGLRNIAVHDYQELNLDIVVHVINNNLSYFQDFIVVINSDSGIAR